MGSEEKLKVYAGVCHCTAQSLSFFFFLSIFFFHGVQKNNTFNKAQESIQEPKYRDHMLGHSDTKKCLFLSLVSNKILQQRQIFIIIHGQFQFSTEVRV